MKQDIYESKVIKEKYGNSFELQLKQLENSGLLKRFKKSREQLSKDPYRPKYHFTSPECSLNDPNGLCYWKGRWHLFYQGKPTEDTRVHWGHAISRDLVNWKDLPYAIYPNPERCCYSGSTLVEKNRVIAMYHGTELGNMIAVSKDDFLLNWEKIIDDAVIRSDSADFIHADYPIFDPCIWEKDGLYYSLSGSSVPHNDKKTRADFLFKSKDLVNWQYMHPFVEDDIFTLVGDDGACPYFWPIGNRHILLFFSHMSGGQALLGDYDKQRNKFVVTSHHKANFGAVRPGGVHAPSATPCENGKIAVIYNMNAGKETKTWKQVMSLPRILSLANKDEIMIEPCDSIESLRYDYKHIGKTDIEANKELIFDDMKGTSIEIEAEIVINNSPMIELNVLRSSNKEEYTSIKFYYERGYRRNPRVNQVRNSIISLETSYSSLSEDVMPRPPENAPVYIEEGESLNLRIFVDKSIVEVFVNGKQCIAARVYPKNKNSNGISIYSRGRSITLNKLDLWQMKEIDYSLGNSLEQL